MDLHVFGLSKYDKVVLGMSPAQMVVCVPKWLDQFYLYTILMSLSFIGGCMVNMNILVEKIGALHICPKNQNSDFLQDSSNDFDSISVICGDHLSKLNCIGGVFREKKVRALGAQTVMQHACPSLYNSENERAKSLHLFFFLVYSTMLSVAQITKC
jgi:hypothetical protein